MSGKRSDAQGEVIEYVLHKRIRYRYRYLDDSKAGSVEETYDISKVGRDCSKVEHEVNLKHAALHFWVKLLAFVFGKVWQENGQRSSRWNRRTTECLTALSPFEVN